jgi:lysozyme family protein
MSATFEKCIPVIMQHEGGSAYTNHPNDPGGSTKYGISLLFLSKLSLLEGDIDHDGDIDADDIKQLSEPQADALYLKYFWNPLNIENLKNDLLILHIFDHGVNAGTRTAVKILQQLVRVSPDGSIGSMTESAISIYSASHNIVGDYANARKRYYDSIIDKNLKLSVFKNGWYNRVDSTHF